MPREKHQLRTALILVIQLAAITSCVGRCKLELGHVEASEKGFCPLKTKLDPHYNCCVPELQIDSNGDELGMQGDSPLECDVMKNQWHPFWDKTCPKQTGFDQDIGCCIPCRKCGPGYEKNTDCLKPCTPCKEQHYSKKPDHNEKCLPCVRCEDYNRDYKETCTPLLPSVCGSCLEGYTDKGKTDDKNPCQEINQENDIHLEQESTNFEMKFQELGKQIQGLIICVAVSMAIVIAVLIFFIIRNKSSQRTTSSTDQQNKNDSNGEKNADCKGPEIESDTENNELYPLYHTGDGSKWTEAKYKDETRQSTP